MLLGIVVELYQGTIWVCCGAEWTWSPEVLWDRPCG